MFKLKLKISINYIHSKLFFFVFQKDFMQKLTIKENKSIKLLLVHFLIQFQLLLSLEFRQTFL